MLLLRPFFGEAAHSQPCDPAICSCFGVVLGLLQGGDANPTWFGLTCGTDGGIKFWDKSTQGIYSSFSLPIPSGAVGMVWGLQWCGAAAPAGSGWVPGTHSSEDFGEPSFAWRVWWEGEGAPSAPPLSHLNNVLVCKASFLTHPSILHSLGW